MGLSWYSDNAFASGEREREWGLGSILPRPIAFCVRHICMYVRSVFLDRVFNPCLPKVVCCYTQENFYLSLLFEENLIFANFFSLEKVQTVSPKKFFLKTVWYIEWHIHIHNICFGIDICSKYIKTCTPALEFLRRRQICGQFLKKWYVHKTWAS